MSEADGAAPGERRQLLEIRLRVGRAGPADVARCARSLEDALGLAAPRLGHVGGVVLGSPAEAPIALPEEGRIAWRRPSRETPDTGSPKPDLILTLSATVELWPRSLERLLAALDDPGIGIVEPRWLPFQSNKPIPTGGDAGTSSVRPAERATETEPGAVSWASAACYLARRQVLAAIGPVGTSFRGAAVTVDICWRARMAGWTVRCVPDAPAFVHGAGPMGDPMLERNVATATSKLRLLDAYGGPVVAGALAAAWSVTGTVAQRRAAAESAAGDAPTSRAELAGAAGLADAFVRELFSLVGPKPPDDPEWPELTIADLGRPERVGEEPSQREGEGEAGGGGGGTPFLSVVVRTQGRRPVELADNLLSLAAQTCDDFEVLVVGHDLDDERSGSVDAVLAAVPPHLASRVRRLAAPAGSRSRPLNIALAEAAGQYVAFLDDDDIALDGWVEEFRRVARRRPGCVAWTQVAWQTLSREGAGSTAMWRVTETPKLFVRQFDLATHLHQNGTPNCGIAIPTQLLREKGLVFREDLAVFEDWEMVLQVAQLAPFVSTETVTALYRRGSPDNSGVAHDRSEWDAAARQVIEGFAAGGFVVRGEHLVPLVRAIEELDTLRREREAGEDDEDDDVTLARRLRLPRGRSVAVETLRGRSVAFISPHLDDAVLSCGELIAALDGPVVVTVFAGEAASWQELTEWDEASGFTAGTNVMKARIAEDDEALAMLGAKAERLGWLDEQYRQWEDAHPSVQEIARDVLVRIREAGTDTVFFPLGIGHEDHRLTGEVGRLLVAEASDLSWHAFLDLPYGYEAGADEELAALEPLQPEAVEFVGELDSELKQAALDRYESQLEALGDERRELALEAERYWRLTPPDRRGDPPAP